MCHGFYFPFWNNVITSEKLQEQYGDSDSKLVNILPYFLPFAFLIYLGENHRHRASPPKSFSLCFLRTENITLCNHTIIIKVRKFNIYKYSHCQSIFNFFCVSFFIYIFFIWKCNARPRCYWLTLCFSDTSIFQECRPVML
jgi:hypothetical protein